MTLAVIGIVLQKQEIIRYHYCLRYNILEFLKIPSHVHALPALEIGGKQTENETFKDSAA